MTQNSNSTFIPFPGANSDSIQRPGGGQPSAGGGAGAAPEPAEPSAGGSGARRGRPSTYHPRIIEMLCQAIRHNGLSDSAAAEQQGMSTTTLSRWKQVHPEVGLQLQQARQEIRVLHLQKIMESASAENGKGWRASAWILERLFPEDYARRISDRFEALNLIEFRKDKERRAVQDEDEKARQERQRAEAAEARAAAAAAAASVSSEGASQNFRNAKEAELPGGELAMECSVRSFGVSPTAADDSRRDAEAPNPEAVPVASCIYSEDDSHNSRNSPREDRAGLATPVGANPSRESERPCPVDANGIATPSETLQDDSAEDHSGEGAGVPSANLGARAPRVLDWGDAGR